MDDLILRQYIVGIGCMILGILGWVLPYGWNILRLGRIVSRVLPESVNLVIPKVLGTILILSGVLIVIGTATVGRFN